MGRSDGVEACQKMCYSDIVCQYWQYSNTEGCFAESLPMNEVPYPLTQNDIDSNSDRARSIIAGEYFLHLCPKHDGPYTSEDEHAKFSMLPWEWNWFSFHWPWEEGGWPWWGWLMAIVLCSCSCGCFVLCCGCLGFLRYSWRTGKAKVKAL